MKFSVKSVCFCFFLFLVLLIFSCAFPFQDGADVNLSDISSNLTYNNISRQAFIGGSLLFNPDQPSSGHLASGVHIGVRLGKVDKNEVIPGQPDFSDRLEDSQYGYITISSIDTSNISFIYNQFSGKGKYKYSSTHSINLNGKEYSSESIFNINKQLGSTYKVF